MSAPSPLEIAIACAAIRSHWSEAERISRIVDDSTRRQHAGWRPPMADASWRAIGATESDDE
jgi:hypothetical protein